MSDGRTPTATLTEQRQLGENDINALHEIVSRAQNDPVSRTSPREALFRAYGEYFEDGNDRSCFDIILKILNPGTHGGTLYERFENVLRDEGIVLSFDDDRTSQDTRQAAERDDLSVSENLSHQGIVPDNIYGSDHQNPLQSPSPIPDDGDHIDTPPTKIAHLMQVAEAYDRRTLLREGINQMRATVKQRTEARILMAADSVEKNNIYLEMVSAADAYYEYRLKRKAFKQMWSVYRDQLEMNHRADNMCYQNLGKRTFGMLNDEYRIHQVQAIDDERLMGVTLYKWALAARERNFMRIRNRKLQSRCLKRWTGAVDKRKAINAELREILDRQQTTKNIQVRRTVITSWAQTCRKIQNMGNMADRQYEQHLGNSILRIWRGQVHNNQEKVQTAADAREYFLMRWALNRIKEVASEHKARRTTLAKWVLSRWREFTEKQKHAKYDDAYRRMRRTIKINIARRVLRRWNEKAREVKSLERVANDLYQESLLHRLVQPAVEKWYDTATQARINDQLAETHHVDKLKRKALQAIEGKAQHLSRFGDMSDLFRQQKSDDMVRKCLRQMQMKAFELQRRGEDAAAFRTRKDRRLTRDMWARLRLAYAQRRGQEPPLDLPPATPAQRRAAELSRLSTTPAYSPFAARLRGEESRNLRETARIVEEVEEDDSKQ